MNIPEAAQCFPNFEKVNEVDIGTAYICILHLRAVRRGYCIKFPQKNLLWRATENKNAKVLYSHEKHWSYNLQPASMMRMTSPFQLKGIGNDHQEHNNINIMTTASWWYLVCPWMHPILMKPRQIWAKLHLHLFFNMDNYVGEVPFSNHLLKQHSC